MSANLYDLLNVDESASSEEIRVSWKAAVADLDPTDRRFRAFSDAASVLLDDRRQVSPGVKFKDSELIGIPTIVVVGRGLAEGTIEIKDRRTGERRQVPVDAAVPEILAEIGQA